MKGKIDEYGILHIFRRGDMREQKCPYANIEDHMPNVYSVCSDFCPHFGEPEAEMEPVTTCTVNEEESCDGDTPMNTLKYEVGLGDDAYQHTLNYSLRINDTLTGCTLLHLCHGTVLVFDEFTDERSAE
jgi:hypothetical protein